MAAPIDPHTGATLLDTQQAAAEPTVNLALEIVGSLTQISVVSGITTNNNTPPGGTQPEGAVYFTGTASTGEWNTHNSVFAIYIQDVPYFTTPWRGCIVEDQTSGRWYRYNGSAFVEMALSSALNKPLIVLNPSATEDIGFFYAERACTIRKVASYVRGTGTPSTTWQLSKGTNPTSTTNVFSSSQTTSSTTSVTTTTTFNSASIPVGSILKLTTSAVTTTNLLHVSVIATEDN